MRECKLHRQSQRENGLCRPCDSPWCVRGGCTWESGCWWLRGTILVANDVTIWRGYFLINQPGLINLGLTWVDITRKCKTGGSCARFEVAWCPWTMSTLRRCWGSNAHHKSRKSWRCGNTKHQLLAKSSKSYSSLPLPIQYINMSIQETSSLISTFLMRGKNERNVGNVPELRKPLNKMAPGASLRWLGWYRWYPMSDELCIRRV